MKRVKIGKQSVIQKIDRVVAGDKSVSVEICILIHGIDVRQKRKVEDLDRVVARHKIVSVDVASDHADNIDCAANRRDSDRLLRAGGYS